MKRLEYGMAVRCKSEKEGKKLLRALQEQGINYSKCGSAEYSDKNNICFVAFGEYSFYHAYMANTDFSDLEK